MTNLVTVLVTVLVGPPCCGKSTYLQSLDYDFVISSDNIVEILCRQNNMAYHEYFQLPHRHKIKAAHNLIFDRLIKESKVFNHVVWDLTNLTIKTRSNIFNYYPEAEFNAVVFDFIDNETLLLQRNKIRAQNQGKYIDEAILKMMFKKYEPVTKSEGFCKIKIVAID